MKENVTITLTKEQLAVLKGTLRQAIGTEEGENWLNKLLDLAKAVDDQTK